MKKNQNSKTTIINIVSGKGGTGKTLISAVLGNFLGNKDLSVLLIDLDFFVRGLTTLLYYHKGEVIQLLDSNKLSISDFFTSAKFGENTKIQISQLGVLKYRSFFIIPSVSSIDEITNWEPFYILNPSNFEFTLKNLIESQIGQYDVIILDSRAGYDTFVALSHEISDVSICVEESDPISKITSDNLIRQLKESSKKPIFRLVNKSQRNQVPENNRAINELGSIPFDMDVMKSFGMESFWHVIENSLFLSSLISSWNIFCQKMGIEDLKLSDSRMSPTFTKSIEKTIGIFGTKNRVLLIYGIILSVLGLIYGIFGGHFLSVYADDPIRLASLVIGLFGLGLTIYAITKRNYPK